MLAHDYRAFVLGLREKYPGKKFDDVINQEERDEYDKFGKLVDEVFDDPTKGILIFEDGSLVLYFYDDICFCGSEEELAEVDPIIQYVIKEMRA